MNNEEISEQVARVYISKLTYEQHLNEQKQRAEGHQGSRMGDIPNDLINLGVVFGVSKHEDLISSDAIREAYNNLRRYAATMGANHIFNARLQTATSGCDTLKAFGVCIVTGNAYKERGKNEGKREEEKKEERKGGKE